ncbi:MAG TPA: CoA transferase [Dehalococcoidia bacterium]|nr:CoA transferase [Dehalococcoidia bacterium]
MADPTAYEALDQILNTSGWARSPEDRVVIEGGDPVLPTAFRLGTAGAAAIAATGVAASDLWRQRIGRTQEVAVSVRDAAAAIRSDRFLRIDGAEPPTPWSPTAGFYETRDGRRIQVHSNFPNHLEAALRVLACVGERDAMSKAIAGWDAFELEEALSEAGMCAAVVHSESEWREVPQAGVVAGMPLSEIVKLGESAPEPLPPGDRPLAGVRVLDLTRVIAGPVGGRTLAAHGADVMRVTSDHLPGFPGSLDIDMGHGKLSASLDLRNDDERWRLLGLTDEADVFLQSYRPGSLAGRGLSPEVLAARRPGLIYATLSAYGHVGPWRERRGFDSIVQSMSGIVQEESGDGPPRHMPAQALDYVSGYLLAFGIMRALARRVEEGGSYLVRVSLAQTGAWIQGLGRTEFTGTEGADVDLSDLLVETETPFGVLQHLGPVVRMSETPPRWERPSVPLGFSAPEWPAR